MPPMSRTPSRLPLRSAKLSMPLAPYQLKSWRFRQQPTMCTSSPRSASANTALGFTSGVMSTLFSVMARRSATVSAMAGISPPW